MRDVEQTLKPLPARRPRLAHEALAVELGSAM
jgi:hypothetical protein